MRRKKVVLLSTHIIAIYQQLLSITRSQTTYVCGAGLNNTFIIAGGCTFRKFVICTYQIKSVGVSQKLLNKGKFRYKFL